MGMFTGVEGAKASFDAKYLGEGHYLLRIDRIKAGRSRQQKDFLAVEMTVLYAFPDGDGPKEKWHRTGEAVSHMMMADHDSFKGNVKALVANLTGCHESEVTENDCEAVCGDAQPFSGLVAEVRARNILTRAQKLFTKISYVRKFPAGELQDMLSEQVLTTYFPGDTLEKMIVEEAEEGS
jgi:hypothetical protein